MFCNKQSLATNDGSEVHLYAGKLYTSKLDELTPRCKLDIGNNSAGKQQDTMLALPLTELRPCQAPLHTTKACNTTCGSRTHTHRCCFYLFREAACFAKSGSTSSHVARLLGRTPLRYSFTLAGAVMRGALPPAEATWSC